MKSRELFSKRLAFVRNKMDLTQPEMAELLGLKERQYVSYEDGDYDNNEKLVAKYSIRLATTTELGQGL